MDVDHRLDDGLREGPVQRDHGVVAVGAERRRGEKFEAERADFEMFVTAGKTSQVVKEAEASKIDMYLMR